MNGTAKEEIDIFIRYLALVIAGIPNLFLFYFLFTPLTILIPYFLLNIFFDAKLLENLILVNHTPISIINACVAGSAYYLMLILNLSTPRIEIKKRLKILFFCFGSFLFINVLRIFLLSIVAINGSPWFDVAHKTFWYLGSGIFVVGIWFASVKLFKIKDIPVMSDIIFLYKNSNLKRKKK